MRVKKDIIDYGYQKILEIFDFDLYRVEKYFDTLCGSTKNSYIYKNEAKEALKKLIDKTVNIYREYLLQVIRGVANNGEGI